METCIALATNNRSEIWSKGSVVGGNIRETLARAIGSGQHREYQGSSVRLAQKSDANRVWIFGYIQTIFDAFDSSISHIIHFHYLFAGGD